MKRGLVEIMGVTTRTNGEGERACDGSCLLPVLPGERYERVMRLDGKVEFFHRPCFEDEFGTRESYGA